MGDKMKLIIVYIILNTMILANTYSVAGISNIDNMKFLIKEVGIDTFQIDIPWSQYHLESKVLPNRVENTFAPLDELSATLNNIRNIKGRVIVQLSIHYVPKWFIEEHPDKLLRNYRGEYEIQSLDKSKHLIPTPYNDFVKYKVIGAWYDYMARFLSKNYSDIIEYINPGILEEGQMSYPWAGYDNEDLVFWTFDSYALEGYRTYLERIFSERLDDIGRTSEKLNKINEKYGTHFLSWSDVRPPQTYGEIKDYRIDSDGQIPYFMDFLEYYAEGPLSTAKFYSDILLQYFPKEKLAIKISHWHRGMKNKRTFAEGRFIKYYMKDLINHYGTIIFLPVQDPSHLKNYLRNAKSYGYKIMIEPTIKIGDYVEVENLIEEVGVDGINIVNIEDFLDNKIFIEYYKNWILILKNKEQENNR